MNIVDMIRNFWISSLKNDFSNFDFEKFFVQFEGMLDYKLANHGFFGLERFKESNHFDSDDIKLWMYRDNPWIRMSPDEVVDVILTHLMNTFVEQLPSEYEDLVRLYNKLMQRDYNSKNSDDLRILISLVDECIHAQHASGFIIEQLDGIDMDDFRKEVEEEWFEELKEKWENRRISIKEIRSSPVYI